MTAGWERHGECNHCGHCCQMVARDVLVRTDEQVARDGAFYRARGFVRCLVDGEPRHVLWAWLHAPCPHHDGSSCDIHSTRPETCKTFPRVPADIVGTPCSYWFERGEARVGGRGSPFPAGEFDLAALEGEEP